MQKDVISLMLCTAITFGIPAINLANQTPLPQEAQEPELGEPIRLTAEKPLERMTVPADRTGGRIIDPSNRQLSRAFYNSVYLASESTPLNWTGDMDTCNQGTTSPDYKNAILARINYYRAMSGVPAEITFAETYNSKDQQAALMMSSNSSLNHYPPNTWSCYSTEGAEAAGKSNLSLGLIGWGAINAYMHDYGVNNEAVGHRRWILYPQTQSMGTGDVPSSSGYSGSNALWVIDGNVWTSRPPTREVYVAWPPPGYVPFQVVPARWSFSYANADFSSATVSVTLAGNPVPVTLHSVQNGYGENTIVWVVGDLDPNGYVKWANPLQDARYSILINGVRINGTPMSFTYEIVIIDPSARGEGELFSTIDANVNPCVGEQRLFTFSSVPFAHSYEILQASLKNGDAPEGGENNLDAVIDGTSAAYPLLTNAASASGSYSFHMAHPNAQTQYFELDRTFIPSAASTLAFKTRLGIATASQHAMAQISVDDGQSWKTIYDQPGTGSVENVFSDRTVPLGDYANTQVRVRFSYQYQEGGSIYTCADYYCGFLVDDIVVSNAQEIIDATILAANNDLSFNFTRQSAAPYALAVRTIAWDGYPALEWGPLHILPTSPTKIVLADAIERLKLLVEGAQTTTLAEVIGILQILAGR